MMPAIMTYFPPPLRIISPDRNSWIELRPYQDESNQYHACEFEVHLDYGHGLFRGRNNSVLFLNLSEFQPQFDEFITDRSIRPALNGTYDCLVMFQGRGNKVELRFCLGDAFCGGMSGTEETHIRGAFAVDGEQLNVINDFFAAWRRTRSP